jgi:hypothetical protein
VTPPGGTPRVKHPDAVRDVVSVICEALAREGRGNPWRKHERGFS